ncbi:uncharacterized protein EMH_0093200 [Eimeria mitis]|uniref:Uncharacterized protein n=1 Tax=Eimeria mitis TaxID=44415 RepID=U6KIM5_9EIME|nr:uncharacterized protein EMH_0093200 [Eimeria mitis]CDJ36656.1 hypothetical protein EMH_0093200 [Eimeria mitis]
MEGKRGGTQATRTGEGHAWRASDPGRRTTASWLAGHSEKQRKAAAVCSLQLSFFCFLKPITNCQTSNQKTDKKMADNYGASLPDPRAEVPAVADLNAPTSLTPVAPLASPVPPTDIAVSNNSTSSLYYSLHSTPRCCTGLLRRRRTKRRTTNQDEHLARVSCHLTMEERLNLCMDVAKNLLDSVSSGTVPRPSVQSGSVSLPSLPLLQQIFPINTSCKGHINGPRHLRVGRIMPRLASPATPGAGAPRPRCDNEATSNMNVDSNLEAATAQQETRNAENQFAEEAGKALERLHF